MGNGATVFTDNQPNIQALGCMVRKYEELKLKHGSVVDLNELYTELEKELLLFVPKNGTDMTHRKEAAKKLKELEDTFRDQKNQLFQKVDNSPQAKSVDKLRVQSDSFKRDKEDFGLRSARRPTQSTTGADDPVSILVVDDSAISCKLALRSLGNLNYKVQTAFSGEVALQKIQNDPNAYDLILLDIVMPGIDGIEVLSKLKSSPSLKHIHVAMLSGLEDQNIAEVCLQQGALEVLLKPLKAEAVQRVVAMYCHKGEGAIVEKASKCLNVGDPAPDFSLMDSTFTVRTLHQKLSDGKKVMLVFFPAAFATNALYGSTLLTEINKKYFAIISTNTMVFGVGKEIPFTMSALVCDMELKFDVLSDPFLDVSQKFVGSFDFGSYNMQVTGLQTAGLLNYESPMAGVVIVDSYQKVVYKWVAAEPNGEPNLALTFDMHKLLEFLDADTKKNFDDLQVDQSESPNLAKEGKVFILVVDDSNISSKLAIRKLSPLGYDTMHAENGKVGLELLRRFPRDFDLVLLDIVMPVMDGIELLNIMQGDDILKHIPVCMLSGLEDDLLVNVCLESGAIAVLRKPIKAEEVQEIVRSRIQKK